MPLETLAKARRILGLSQRQMADLLGISRCFYTQIEGGTRRPSLDVALKISEVLGIPVNNIFAPKDVVNHNIKTTGTEGAK